MIFPVVWHACCPGGPPPATLAASSSAFLFFFSVSVITHWIIMLLHAHRLLRVTVVGSLRRCVAAPYKPSELNLSSCVNLLLLRVLAAADGGGRRPSYDRDRERAIPPHPCAVFVFAGGACAAAAVRGTWSVADAARVASAGSAPQECSRPCSWLGECVLLPHL